MDSNEASRIQDKLRNEQKAKRLKRFYKKATTAPVEGGFGVFLDDRAIKTPMKSPLTVPTAALGEAIAAEWMAQGEFIEPEVMPFTKFANTALDRVEGRREAIIADFIAYAGSDLLCYRADGPESLVNRQIQSWDPILDWARTAHGIELNSTTGIIHTDQPAESLNRLAKLFDAEDCFVLAALHNVTTLTGSAVLALAYGKGATSAQDVWTAAHVDEDWNIEQWGSDVEAEALRASRRKEFDGIVTFFEATAKITV